MKEEEKLPVFTVVLPIPRIYGSFFLLEAILQKLCYMNEEINNKTQISPTTKKNKA